MTQGSNELDRRQIRMTVREEGLQKSLNGVLVIRCRIIEQIVEDATPNRRNNERRLHVLIPAIAVTIRRCADTTDCRFRRSPSSRLALRTGSSRRPAEVPNLAGELTRATMG